MFDHQQSTAGGTFITECPTERANGTACQKWRKDIDGASILAFVHSGWLDLSGSEMLAPANSPIAAAVARTVQVHNQAFCELYPINKAASGAGIPGILYGRYEEGGRD